MSEQTLVRTQRGAVMVTVIVLAQVLFLLGLGVLTLAERHYSSAARHGHALRALAAAEAGVEDAIQRLRFPDVPGHGITDWGLEFDDDWNATVTYQTPGVGNQFTVIHHLADPACDRATQECMVALNASGNPFYLITSEGQSGSVRRVIQAVVHLEADRLVFGEALCSLGDLVLIYRGDLAAYDSQEPAWSNDGRHAPEKARPVGVIAHENLTVDWARIRGRAIASGDITLGTGARILQTVHGGLDLNIIGGRVAEEACGGRLTACRGATVRGDVIIGMHARIAGEVRYGGSWTEVAPGWQVDAFTAAVPPPSAPELQPCAQPRLHGPEGPPSGLVLRVTGQEVLAEGVHTFDEVVIERNAVLTIRGAVRLHTRRFSVSERGRVEMSDTAARAGVLHLYLDCRGASERRPCGLTSEPGSSWNEGSRDPTRLLIVVTGSPPGDVNLPAILLHRSTFVGAAYAPDATIQIGQGATVFGAQTAKRLAIIEPRFFAYDLALHRLGIRPLIKEAKIVRWQRLPR